MNDLELGACVVGAGTSIAGFTMGRGGGESSVSRRPLDVRCCFGFAAGFFSLALRRLAGRRALARVARRRASAICFSIVAAVALARTDNPKRRASRTRSARVRRRFEVSAIFDLMKGEMRDRDDRWWLSPSTDASQPKGEIPAVYMCARRSCQLGPIELDSVPGDLRIDA
ncbi:MAG: hypothetical protein HYR85_20265 [Planctomycetes bacterium]|nr:hypothetical protein [Planctomycetota bacterium]